MSLTPALRFLSNHHWALAPMVFEALAAIVERHAAGDTQALGLLGDDSAKVEEPRMQIVGSVAVIPVRGVLARYADQVNGICQKQGRSADSLQADLNRAALDTTIRQIVLRIDSPGGTVAGTAETADLIRAISAKGKSITAYVDGLAGSAALWLASQADHIVASSAAAEIGSLGIIAAHVDVSRQSEARGAKVHIFRSVALKAPGTMGEALNADQVASIQRQIGELHQAFAQSVQAGRGLTDEQLAAVANGEVWTAERAIALGLVDRIAAWDDLLTELNGGPKATSPALKAGASASATDLPTQTAHAAEGSPMSMKILAPALAALCNTHQADAHNIVADATAGLEEAAIKTNIETRKQSAAVAAQITALTGERDQLTAKVASTEAARAALATENEQLKTKLATAEGKLAKVAGFLPPDDVGNDDPSKRQAKRQIPIANADKLTVQDATDLKAGRAELV